MSVRRPNINSSKIIWTWFLSPLYTNDPTCQKQYFIVTKKIMPVYRNWLKNIKKQKNLIMQSISRSKHCDLTSNALGYTPPLWIRGLIGYQSTESTQFEAHNVSTREKDTERGVGDACGFHLMIRQVHEKPIGKNNVSRSFRYLQV